MSFSWTPGISISTTISALLLVDVHGRQGQLAQARHGAGCWSGAATLRLPDHGFRLPDAGNGLDAADHRRRRGYFSFMRFSSSCLNSATSLNSR